MKHNASNLGRFGAALALSVILTAPAVQAGVTAIGVTNVSNGTTHQIFNPTGTLLPIGTGVAGIGYFKTITDVAIAALNGPTPTTSLVTPVAVAALAADFELFGSTTPMVDFLATGFDGLYDFAPGEDLGAGNVFTDPGLRPDNTVGPEPTSVYTFIGNALDFASSTEIFIVRHSAALDFTPDPTAGPTSVNASTDWALNAPGNGGSDDNLILVGFQGFHANVDTPPLGPDGFTLATLGIPEPSRAMLLLVGLVGVVMRRRR